MLHAYGRPVRGWAVWIGAASVVQAVALDALPTAWTRVVFRLGLGYEAVLMLTLAVYAIFGSLIGTAAMALAAWGRRWRPTWPLWFSGRVLLALLPAVVSYAAWRLMRHSLELTYAEATAWLLWRVVLPARPAEGLAAVKG